MQVTVCWSIHSYGDCLYTLKEDGRRRSNSVLDLSDSIGVYYKSTNLVFCSSRVHASSIRNGLCSFAFCFKFRFSLNFDALDINLPLRCFAINIVAVASRQRGYFGISCAEFTLNLRICHWSPCLIRPSVIVASPFSNVAFVAYCAEMTLPFCVVADMRACPCGGSYFWNRPRLPNQLNI